MITPYEFARACYQSSIFLLCIVKRCCITKDCCVPWKIVLHHERLLCSVKNCFVSRKIFVYRKKLFCITKDCCVSSSILSCALPLWATVLNKGKQIWFGFKQPLVGEKRCVMTQITAAEETSVEMDCAYISSGGYRKKTSPALIRPVIWEGVCGYFVGRVCLRIEQFF